MMIHSPVVWAPFGTPVVATLLDRSEVRQQTEQVIGLPSGPTENGLPAPVSEAPPRVTPCQRAA
jgi:hypothetical protein